MRRSGKRCKIGSMQQQTEQETVQKNGPRKYALSQRVRIKSENGPHKVPPPEAKGALATIAIQSITDWLESSQIMPAEFPRSYYVELEGGATVLVGEDWLEATEQEFQNQRARQPRF